MADPRTPITGADVLVRQLVEHGVRHVFGYPGGQISPIYDALYREPAIRHFLARDERAAAYMADGYARATGLPGVCLAVCGPGVYNAATPLATAYTDSIPMLMISGQVPAKGRGLRSGYYHENDQLSAVESMCKHRVHIDNVETMPAEFGRAFTAMTHQRPGPAFVEVPVDVLRHEQSEMPAPSPPTVLVPRSPSPEERQSLVQLIATWKKPLILAGGGVVTASASESLVQLAEQLGAPVFHTAMGKGAIAGDHPLCAGIPWLRATSDLSDMASFFSPLFDSADGLLVIGCRFSQLCTGGWTMPLPKSIAQIDVDPAEIGRHYAVSVGVHADAQTTLRALLADLPSPNRRPWSDVPARPTPALGGIDLLAPLRRILPRNAIIAADVTRLSYLMLTNFPVYEPRTFLNPAGFVSMGYGIPAALGAKAAFPDRTVVAIVGDGCFMMSGLELATAVQEKLPIVVILINDGSLSLIKSIQERRYQGRYLGVDMQNPDFQSLASAFGVRSWRVRDAASFVSAVSEVVGAGEPSVVEVQIM
jgi:acetolactate synthase-1/2/3 large subunit